MWTIKRNLQSGIVQIYHWKTFSDPWRLSFCMQQARAKRSFSCFPCRFAPGRTALSAYLDSLPEEYATVHAALYPSASGNALPPTAKSGNHTELRTRYALLERAIPKATDRLEKINELAELENLGQDLEKADDKEMLQIAEEDIKKTKAAISRLEEEIVDILVPEDLADAGDLVIEVTAGVGGQEAMLFANEIFNMYQRYSAFRGWSFEQDEIDESDIGGYRKASAFITGRDAYRSLKFESGVHRVQRIPKTEKYGRVQTSTIAVAVLPRPRDPEVILKKSDLKIETCRSSSKGGQNVNKLDTAVRIVHLPTNIAVECQEERVQQQNMQKAMDKLAAILYQQQVDAANQKVNSMRKLQTGASGRSEKIRTYNFPDDRLTDHRIGHSINGLEDIFRGNEKFHSLMQHMWAFCRRESVEQLIANVANSAKETVMRGKVAH